MQRRMALNRKAGPRRTATPGIIERGPPQCQLRKGDAQRPNVSRGAVLVPSHSLRLRWGKFTCSAAETAQRCATLQRYPKTAIWPPPWRGPSTTLTKTIQETIQKKHVARRAQMARLRQCSAIQSIQSKPTTLCTKPHRHVLSSANKRIHGVLQRGDNTEIGDLYLL